MHGLQLIILITLVQSTVDSVVICAYSWYVRVSVHLRTEMFRNLATKGQATTESRGLVSSREVQGKTLVSGRRISPQAEGFVLVKTQEWAWTEHVYDIKVHELPRSMKFRQVPPRKDSIVSADSNDVFYVWLHCIISSVDLQWPLEKVIIVKTPALISAGLLIGHKRRCSMQSADCRRWHRWCVERESSKPL